MNLSAWLLIQVQTHNYCNEKRAFVIIMVLPTDIQPSFHSMASLPTQSNLGVF